MPLTVPESFRKPLIKVAYKLLSRDKATFEELTLSEKTLWTSFETDQIYRLLTGEPDTVPEFRFNWYTVAGGDASAEFIPAQPSPSFRPGPLPPIQLAVIPPPKIRGLRASTSAAPASSASSTKSPASTVPLSPMATTSRTVPKPPVPLPPTGSS
jgi:hypothetical protein